MSKFKVGDEVVLLDNFPLNWSGKPGDIGIIIALKKDLEDVRKEFDIVVEFKNKHSFFYKYENIRKTNTKLIKKWLGLNE